MLSGGYASVLEARTRDEFRGEIVRFAQRMEFRTVSALTVVDRLPGRSQFFAVDNTPDAYREAYFDSSCGRADPVMQHCKRQSVPIVWDQATYVESGQATKWEHQARYGYCTGVAMALHLPEGRHFVLGVDRDQPLPEDPDQLQRLVADIQLFAVVAHEAAQRILLPPDDQAEQPGLRARELEVLRWTMEGKTAWEVGAILGITERTAVHHLRNASEKLRCVNKHQAVVKALRLGLIH